MKVKIIKIKGEESKRRNRVAGDRPVAGDTEGAAGVRAGRR